MSQQLDFNDYRVKSKYAKEINQGYSAQLGGAEMEANPHDDQKQEGRAIAWQLGWFMATKDAKRIEGRR